MAGLAVSNVSPEFLSRLTPPRWVERIGLRQTTRYRGSTRGYAPSYLGLPENRSGARYVRARLTPGADRPLWNLVRWERVDGHR
ncbi:hypothetical protein FRAHR75_420011 [Frankia sp. Hr75.2]|nr:hypothetical protein FRAHR75_420011 [Frankia sp. Hr75.2]